MLDSTLSHIFSSQWRVIGIVVAVLLLASEVGFRFGLSLYRTKDDARRGQISGIQGAMLGLLGLLLGFTFAMATARYEARRALVLSEANAIRTTYFRTELLPEAHQADIQSLLRRYVDVRLRFYEVGEDTAAEADAERAAAQIQRELWLHVVAMSKSGPPPLLQTFINALSDTIDRDAERMNALRARVPAAVWLLVLAVACCGCVVSGYGAGASGTRNAFANGVLPVLIAVVITLIADIDRPRGGMIGISQQAMIDLKQALQSGGM